jgi:hypothetical protein
MTSLERIAELLQIARDEDQPIDQASVDAALAFFRASTIEPFRPRITLSPEGRVRVHWTWGLMREF